MDGTVAWGEKECELLVLEFIGLSLRILKIEPALGFYALLAAWFMTI